MMRRLLGVLILLLVVAGGAVLWMNRSGAPAPQAGETARDVAASPYFSAEDRLVEAAGLDWRVRESGPADAPALVLIHGFSHSLEAWEPWAERLDDAYRVIRFDLPGHALTGPHPESAYSNLATVEQVAALLDAAAPERFAIGGNSLGGLVAWRYAAAHPDRVAALVLVSPGGYSINGVTEEPAAVPLPVAMYLRTAPDPAVQAATGRLYGDAGAMPEGEAERIAALMREPGVGEALVERLQQFTLPDPEADLARVAAPTLILWGEADAMVPAEHGTRFEAAIPDARLVTYEGVGHVAMQEAPDVTASEVRAFLATAFEPGG